MSQKKNRLKFGDFNLDLTYITNRIIACGYPSTSFEALYRNDKSQFTNFLSIHHGQMVKIYNLCGEDYQWYEQK